MWTDRRVRFAVAAVAVGFPVSSCVADAPSSLPAASTPSTSSPEGTPKTVLVALDAEFVSKATEICNRAHEDLNRINPRQQFPIATVPLDQQLEQMSNATTIYQHELDQLRALPQSQGAEQDLGRVWVKIQRLIDLGSQLVDAGRRGDAHEIEAATHDGTAAQQDANDTVRALGIPACWGG